MESELISVIMNEIAEHNRSFGAELEVGPGDDGAVLRLRETGARIVVSSDSSVEGVHFDFDFMQPDQIGERAMAGAMSDLVAMLAEPVSANISLVLPQERKNFRHKSFLQDFYRGVVRALRTNPAVVAGGNLGRLPIGSEGPIMIDITVVGSIGNWRAPLRNGARAGDRLAISGPVGHSALGLKLLKEDAEALDLVSRFELPQVDQMMRTFFSPKPRFDLLPALRESACTSLIDISDGLSKELRTLSDKAGVGFKLNWQALKKTVLPLPLPHPKKQFDIDDSFVPWLVFGGGEDYELLGTFSGKIPNGFFDIGEVTNDVGIIQIESDQGSLHNIPPLGFDHFG